VLVEHPVDVPRRKPSPSSRNVFPLDGLIAAPAGIDDTSFQPSAPFPPPNSAICTDNPVTGLLKLRMIWPSLQVWPRRQLVGTSILMDCV
jgi:hypothetical protein